MNKREKLPAIIGGETPMATGIPEPTHGPTLARVEIRAKRGGSEWLINGHKM